MKCGIGAALAVGAGYVLGRRRKMRMAAMLAGATAVGGIGGLGGSVLRRGAKAVGSSELLDGVAPQLGEVAGKVRGDLLDAGKAAALAAVTGRIDSLTDSLHERADTLRAPAGQAAEAAGETTEGLRRQAHPERSAGRDRTRARAGEDRTEPDEPDEIDEPGEAEDEGEFDDSDDFDEPEAAPVRRRTRHDRPAVSRGRR
jgi:hypothetical protein